MRKSLIIFAIVKVFFVMGLGCGSALFAQSHRSTQSHTDSVNTVALVDSHDGMGKSFFTAGADGFLIKWNEEGIGEHFQISDLDIKLVAVAPNGNDVAVFETNGGLVNRVSVWDWKALKRKYARRFKDSVTSLNFSARGTYLMIGTASVEGVVFLRSDNGAVINKISEATGIVTTLNTSDSERTAVFYTPTGFLSYYNLQTGKLKEKVAVQGNMDQCTLFNNSMTLLGVRGSYIYAVNAISGKTIKTIQAENPLILGGSSLKDSAVKVLQNDEKGNYTLSSLEALDSTNIEEPKLIKEFKGPRLANGIRAGVSNDLFVMLGGADGTVYRSDMSNYATAENFTAITEDTYERILDITSAGEDFYFLTKRTLLRASYQTGEIDLIGNNDGYTNIIPYGDHLIMYSKGTRTPVVLYNGSQSVVLFTPAASLQTLRLFGSTLVDLEASSTVNVFDMDERKLTEVYTGSALQDAILAKNPTAAQGLVLYVSKSAQTNPFATLLKIDIATRETVPINLGGSVVFALNTHNGELFGVSIQVDDDKKNTAVFRYNPAQKRKTTLLRIADEDGDAFTTLFYPFLYTNIGKDNIRSCNLAKNQNIVYRRSASIPQKVCQNSNKVAVLNMDGSVSWYTPDSSKLLSVWYYTKDGQLFEFR